MIVIATIINLSSFKKVQGMTNDVGLAFSVGVITLRFTASIE